MNNIYTYFTIILLSIVGLKCDLFPPDNTLLVCKLGALSEVLPICHHMKLDTIMTWNENITFTFYIFFFIFIIFQNKIFIFPFLENGKQFKKNAWN